MSHHESTASFLATRWDEAPYQEIDGATKLVMSEVEQTYTGSQSGQREIRYPMLQFSDGATTFTGLGYVTCSLDGRDEPFGIRWDGDDDGTAARGRGTIVPGSGTGSVVRLTSDACYEATRSGDVAFADSWHLDAAN